jgi:hypothetical protein
MRHLRSLGATLVMLFALGSLADLASAEEGFLPRTNPNFTIKAKQFIFEDTNGVGITCKTLEAKNKLENDKHASLTLSLTGCTTGGTAVNSLGDAKELVLAPVLLLVCLVNPPTLLFGLAFETTGGTLHIEEPVLGALVDLAGRIIAHVLTAGPALKYVFDLAGVKGAGNVAECSDSVGGKKWTLTSELNHNGKALLTSVRLEEGSVTFEESQTLMDT